MERLVALFEVLSRKEHGRQRAPLADLALTRRLTRWGNLVAASAGTL